MNIINVDLKNLFPELYERMEYLCNLKKFWPSIVGKACAKRSVPYDLVGGILYIYTENLKASQRLNNMAGNIISNCNNDFVRNIKILNKMPGRKKIKFQSRSNAVNKNKIEIIAPEESDINKLIDPELKKLNPDAAEAIASLQAFFNKNF